MTAKAKTLADCLMVKGRFRRSTHLEKDFLAASQNGDYIVTPTAREALRRLTEGMGNGSPFRAWTLTGPYGVGKSAFAVFLTRLLCAAGTQGQQARSQQARSQLEQADPALIAQLIADLDLRLVHFYAWQYGRGCHKKLPKQQELMQLPGRGDLDFIPIVAALKKIDYGGWTEVFMHPVPRGIPILPTKEEVTAHINQARDYLDECLSKDSRLV